MFQKILFAGLAIFTLGNCGTTPENCRGESPVEVAAASVAMADNTREQGIFFVSTDDGATWSGFESGLPEGEVPNSALTLPGGPVMLICPRGIYSSTPPVGPWALVAPVFFNDMDILHSGASGLYACRRSGGLYMQAYGSTVWLPIDFNLPDRSVFSAVELPDGSVLVVCPSGIYKTTDKGGVWQHVYPRESLGRMYAIGNTVVVNGFRHIVRSTDGGITWEKVVSDNESYKLISANGDHFTAFITTAQGWQQLHIPANESEVAEVKTGKIKSLPVQDNLFQVLMRGNSIFCSHKEGISRSLDGGATWQLVLPTPDSKWVYKLDVSGNMLYAVRDSGC